MADKMTVERATEFAESWNTHDADKVLAYFAEGATFHGPTGRDHLGDTNVGKAAIHEAVTTFFKDSPKGQFKNLKVRVYGDAGIFEWDFEDTDQVGNKSVVAGCDLLQFKGDMIFDKSVFLKRPVD